MAAVEHRPALQQHRHGHLHPVARRRHEPPYLVTGGVVATRDLLPFHQGPGPGLHVVIVDRAGRHQRRIGKAEGARVELGIVGGEDAVGNLRECHVVRLVGAEVGHPEPPQPARPLAHHDEPLEGVHALDKHRVAVRQPVGPTRGGEVVLRDAHEAEVPGLVVRVQQEEAVGMLDAVLDAGPARRDHPWGHRRRRGRNHAPLGRGKAVGGDEHVFAAARAEHAHVIQHVVFLEHFGVARPRGPDHVPPHRVAALGGVGGHVEEGAVVVRPRRSVPDVGDRIGQPAGAQILHVEGVLPECRGVLDVQQQLRVGAHVEAAQRMEPFSGRQGVLIEDHFLRCRKGAPLAAVDGVRLALLGAGVVPVPVVLIRDAEVGFLDATEQLAVQLLLQGFGVFHPGGGVGVLRLEVGEDRGVLLLAQPVVVVDQDFAVERVDLGDSRGDGRGLYERERQQQSEHTTLP